MLNILTRKTSSLFQSIALSITLALSLCLLPLSATTYAQAPPQENQALLLSINGAIGPAVSDYVGKGLERADNENFTLIILQMDTPGGLDSAMRSIIKKILASPIPIVSHVWPEGSRAASAGTYILYASHVAAMAPATNLGAATPVSIGGLPSLPNPGSQPGEESEGEGSPKIPATDPMKAKVLNDATAYIKSLAARHNRNEEWAEQAVRESVSLTATEALELNVIDLMASDIDDLLEQLNGRTIPMDTGQVRLNTEQMKIIRHDPDWRDRLLAAISDPNIAYILLLVGIYGLIFEATHPGALLPGIVGAIALLLAFYTFQILPVNYAGLGLLLLGLALMVAEVFAPSFGVLGLGGIAAFVFGSIILVQDEQLRISLHLIASTALSSAAFIFWLTTRIYRLRRQRVRTGSEELTNLIVRASNDFTGHGWVLVHGESWQAQSTTPIHKNQQVRIVNRDGLYLQVEPLNKSQHKEP
ncbi:MAG: nodulation protein NfeD [Desulfobulbaceae bacterium]|uniref:Nodulation protein NfeD n=1 Tax=Candidatus Desulfatifera sulfidica TaxID=2841691 RepID=A0A8J6T9T0_9BACT|nr:nodulation protein NfeD [Candidatus Desulfatifera sulfidica]